MIDNVIEFKPRVINSNYRTKSIESNGLYMHRIVIPAMRNLSGDIVPCFRHSTSDRIFLANFLKRGLHLNNLDVWQRGFIDNRGNFLDCVEAYSIALTSGQVERRKFTVLMDNDICLDGAGLVSNL